MKTIFSYLFAAGLCTGAAAYVYWPDNAPVQTTAITVAVDRTDTLIAQPEQAAIINAYGLKTSPHNGADFRFHEITDVAYTPVIDAHLAAIKQSEMSQTQRPKEVKAFIQKVRDAYSNLHQPGTRDYSSIYARMATELKKLSESHAEKKLYVLYSDLHENSTISFYEPETLELIKSDPEKVEGRLLAIEPLPKSLDGIEIHIVFQPKDQLDSQTFSIISSFYKAMLEGRGAVVTIGANLTL